MEGHEVYSNASTGGCVLCAQKKLKRNRKVRMLNDKSWMVDEHELGDLCRAHATYVQRKPIADII